jgi:hypothetical protein
LVNKVHKRSEIIHTETVTEQGECRVFINVQLDINVNGDGSITAKVNAKPIEEESQPDWSIPDFSSGTKMKFGKEIK